MKYLLLNLMVLLITTGCAPTMSYYSSPIQKNDLSDNDHDGIANFKDQCHGTPENAVIDKLGCSTTVMESEEMKVQVLFEHNSDNIPAAFKDELSQVADLLSKHPNVSIELQGHTSYIGSKEANLALSKRRANNVRNEIISHGINPARITTIGHGFKYQTENTGTLQEALSRKVEAHIVGYNETIKQQWSIFSIRNK